MAKKITTSKTGKKLIAGIVATTIIAGAGVAGGMAIQNAYADPNAGGDITRLETDLTTEKASHEATKAELAEVKAELESEQAQAVQDEAKIAELEARVAELEQQLTRDETKLYFDEYLGKVKDPANVRCYVIDEGVELISSLNHIGVYTLNSDFSMNLVSQNTGAIDNVSSTENYTVMFSSPALPNAPMLVYNKSNKTFTETALNIKNGTVMFVNNVFENELLITYQYTNDESGEIETETIRYNLDTNEVMGTYSGIEDIYGIQEATAHDLGDGIILLNGVHSPAILDKTNNTLAPIEELRSSGQGIGQGKGFYYTQGIDYENKIVYFMDDFDEVACVYNAVTGEVTQAETTMFTVALYINGEHVGALPVSAVRGQRVEDFINSDLMLYVLGAKSSSDIAGVRVEIDSAEPNVMVEATSTDTVDNIISTLNIYK